MCYSNKIDVVKQMILLLFLLHYEHGLSHNLRTKRYFVYPPPGNLTVTKVQLIFGLGLPMEVDVSTIIGYVMKCNYALPSNASYLTNPYIRYARSMKYGGKVLKNFSSSLNEKDRDQSSISVKSMTRYEIYRFFESAIDTFQSGKACILRAICESAGTSLNKNSGLFAQLLHTFLTPSSTIEKFENSYDQEYHAAEIIGKKEPNKCEYLFHECENDILSHFTEVF
ncbi:uncharacterized protein LOC127278706 [Leptopilina boulardi]|uniref:uncharacterized protein LOC127278706 n=1 Tax=Leptopilina boulardi TaxID=63433 RepID=UPI0021F5F3EC|nr:uncharacterized protein LOC127278706 [Leptopilina boulardi]